MADRLRHQGKAEASGACLRDALQQPSLHDGASKCHDGVVLPRAEQGPGVYGCDSTCGQERQHEAVGD